MGDRQVKQYFLNEGIYLGLAVDRPIEELETYYYDNTPMITLHSKSDYVCLSFITDDDNTSRCVLMTPKQAKEVAKVLSKNLKRLAKKIK